VPGGKTLKTMEDATNAYLAREKNTNLNEYAPPKTMLVQAAEKMVRHRRARERAAKDDPQRWEHYMGMRLRTSSATTSEEGLEASKASSGK
jgi:hypothetical protein